MSFFEELLKKGLDQLGSNVLTGEKFDDLTNKISQELDALDEGPIKDVGRASLAEFISRKSDFLHLKTSGLVMFFTHLAGGKDHKAKLELIRNTQNADDLIAGMWEDAGIVARQKRAEDEWEQAALDLIKSVGQKGAQILLPIILGLI